jgi:glutamate receptor, ionotropic, plant
LVTDPMQLLHNGDYVGYQNGSFVHSMLRRLQFKDRQIMSFSTQEEYAYALRKGSKEGGVSAIFDETPYINSFLLLYGKDFQKVGPIDRTVGFGFVSSLKLMLKFWSVLTWLHLIICCTLGQAFPKGSPLVEDLSKAMLNLIEGSEGSNIERKWFGDRILSLDYGSPDTSFSRLSSRSFEGLFIINGCVLGLMFLINCSRHAYAKFTAKRNAAAASDGEAQPSTNGNGIPAI